VSSGRWITCDEAYVAIENRRAGFQDASEDEPAEGRGTPDRTYCAVTRVRDEGLTGQMCERRITGVDILDEPEQSLCRFGILFDVREKVYHPL